MRKIFVYLACVFALGCSLAVYSQDAHFSQYYNTPLLVNPAKTGEYSGNGRFVLNYRNQWASVPGNPYTTYAFSGDRSFLDGALAVGIIALSDRAGDADMGIMQTGITVATRVNTGNDNYLKFGLSGAWTNFSLNASDLTWNSQFDGNSLNPAINSGESFVNEKFHYLDISSGILWHKELAFGRELNLSVSAYHIFQPLYRFYSISDQLDLRWTGQADIVLPLKGSNISFYPSLLFLRQGKHQELTTGIATRVTMGLVSRYTGYYKGTYLYMGCYYRYQDALIGSIMLDYKSQFQLGISYDLTLSTLSYGNHSGGTEISLVYTIPEKPLIELAPSNLPD